MSTKLETLLVKACQDALTEKETYCLFDYCSALGSNLDIPINGLTPLDLSIKASRPKIAIHLIEHRKVNISSVALSLVEEQMQKVHPKSDEYQDYKMLLLLIEDSQVSEMKSFYSLMEVMKTEDVKIFELALEVYLEKGFNINAVMPDCTTLLTASLLLYRFKHAEVLLTHGAFVQKIPTVKDIFGTNMSGMTTQQMVEIFLQRPYLKDSWKEEARNFLSILKDTPKSKL